MNTGTGISRMRDLVTTFMKMGGQELQINVIDAEVLHDAVKNPEQYSDLLIRVAGYSAFFTGLDSDVQAEIISRMEQAVS